jgi:hypothetical protein
MKMGKPNWFCSKKIEWSERITQSRYSSQLKRGPLKSKWNPTFTLYVWE